MLSLVKDSDAMGKTEGSYIVISSNNTDVISNECGLSISIDWNTTVHIHLQLMWKLFEPIYSC